MHKMVTVVVGLALLMSLGHVEGGHVLLYPFGHCFNSHLLNFEKMAITLIEGGHRVDMLINSNYEDYVHRKTSQRPSSMTLQTFKAPEDFVPVCDRHNIHYMLTTPTAQRFNHLMDTFSRYCDAILSDRQLMVNMKQTHYDLFIFDSLDPCGRVLADYLDVIFMPLMTIGLGHWDGNPRPPSYVPSTLSTLTPSMTFWQRTLNLLTKVTFDVIPVLGGFDDPFERLKQQYNLNTTLSISKTFNRAAIKFVNSDFAYEYPSPIEPDTIMIGGFSIDPPSELHGDIKRIVDEAGPSGIIVFSFGTLISQYDSRYIQIFLHAFAKMPQTIIWKISNSSLVSADVPSNVLMMPWIPQSVLLAHPNTRLFITHCGLNGAMEAAYFGIPLVAIPIADDQFNHAAKLVNHLKMGVQLDLKTLSSDDLHIAMVTVINSSSYTSNAKRASSVFRDQPLSKKELIRFWVGWILRHKGAPYLHSVAHTLTWYQYSSIDSIIFLFSLTSMIVWLLSLIIFRVASSVILSLVYHDKSHLNLDFLVKKCK